MSEPPPTWKITPPLDPGAPYHVWHEGDQAWGEAHADWDAEPKLFRVPAETLAPEERIWAEQALIAVTARLALPALAEMLRLWPFPVVDIEPVKELVRVLSELDSALQ